MRINGLKNQPYQGVKCVDITINVAFDHVGYGSVIDEFERALLTGSLLPADAFADFGLNTASKVVSIRHSSDGKTINVELISVMDA